MAECDLTAGIEIIGDGHRKCAIVVTIPIFWDKAIERSEY
jgi:hypothetical protein